MKKSILSPPSAAEKKEETGSWYDPSTWADNNPDKGDFQHWPWFVGGAIATLIILKKTLG